MSDEITELHELKQQRRQRADELERAKEGEAQAETAFFESGDSESEHKLEDAVAKRQSAERHLARADHLIEQARERENQQRRQQLEAEIKDLRRQQAEHEENTSKHEKAEVEALRKAHEAREQRKQAAREAQNCAAKIRRIRHELDGVEYREKTHVSESGVGVVQALGADGRRYLNDVAQEVERVAFLPAGARRD